jgi:hypothetical protein
MLGLTVTAVTVIVGNGAKKGTLSFLSLVTVPKNNLGNGAKKGTLSFSSLVTVPNFCAGRTFRR